MKLPCVAVYQDQEGKPTLVKEKDLIVDGRRALRNSEMVYDLMKDAKLAYRAQEAVMAIYCNNQMRPVSCSEIGRGSVNTCVFPIREIIQCALLSNALVTSVIMVHNHPTGDTSPSTDDVASTVQLKEALDLLNMKLQDHIVVSPGGYTSMKENGLI